MASIGHVKYSASAADHYTHLITQMVAAGWTLHDDIAATNKVYKSNGEDGAKLYGYVRVYVSTYIYVESWTQWNATTHAGVGSGYLSNNFITGTNTTAYFGVYGNKDLIAACAHGVSNGLIVFGHLPTQVTTTPKAVLASNASSGSDVTVTVDSTSGFGAGRYYIIVGQNYEGRDRIQVKSITNATQMVITSLPRNYDTGAVISPFPLIFGHSAYASPQVIYLVVHPDTSGTTATTNSMTMVFSQIAYPQVALDTIHGPRYILAPLFAYLSGTLKSQILGVCNNGLFFFCFGSLLNDVVGVMTGGNIPVAGQATEAGGANTITCSTAAWTVDAYQDWYVYISAGTGVGQIRKIASNTATVLTTNVNWTTAPDSTSVFKIVEKTYRVLVAVHWTVLETDHTA